MIAAPARTNVPLAILEAVYPDRVRYDGREVVVGRVGYATISAVLSAGGSVEWSELGRSAWGDPEVPRSSVAPAVSRLNQKLADLGYPGQLGVDRGRVVLT